MTRDKVLFDPWHECIWEVVMVVAPTLPGLHKSKRDQQQINWHEKSEKERSVMYRGKR